MTIKIKLSSGKEIELTPKELTELLGIKTSEPICLPFIQTEASVPSVWYATTGDSSQVSDNLARYGEAR